MHFAVQADVEADVAQLEGDEVFVAGMKRQLQQIVVEAEHPLQVIGPEGYSYNAGNHLSYQRSAFSR